MEPLDLWDPLTPGGDSGKKKSNTFFVFKVSFKVFHFEKSNAVCVRACVCRRAVDPAAHWRADPRAAEALFFFLFYSLPE